MSNYPEHDKLSEISDKSQAIGEFLEAMSESGFSLCYFDRSTERYFPVMRPVSDLLAEHFGIDRAKLEQEKRAMLDELRQAHPK